jgi:SAM-dependent methyltransferase
MPSREHWETVYRDRVPELLTWYQAEPALSLSLIAASRVEPDTAVVDVGGGSSRLVDHLLERGFTNVTVLDISPTALRYARDRLADRADEAIFIEGDVLEHHFDSAIGFWHDRAVFHFLTEPTDQNRYVERLNTTIAADGHVVIATFGLDGPEQCSGLPVQRYGPETLSQALGTTFEPAGFHTETHITPTGATQAFLYGHFRRVGSPPN